MKAQTADDSASFERPAARSSTVLRSVIALVGSDRRFMVGGMLLISLHPHLPDWTKYLAP